MEQVKKQSLPEKFSALEPFVSSWDRLGIEQQYEKRLSSSMEEMQAFYEVVKPRILEIREYLDGKKFSEYTESDRSLGRLAIAWVPVAEAIEVFKQAKVPDSKMYWEIVEEPHLF